MYFVILQLIYMKFQNDIPAYICLEEILGGILVTPPAKINNVL